jgi:hypothetical protein
MKCTGPDISTVVFLHSPNPVVCKRSTVEWIIFENFEFISIKAIQSILRTDPDIPEAVL